ncbi:FtsH protease activity modulator HflK [Halorhodospira neutriphila]|uniref:Protein HflK n=1 Tax=Halorhodospira neutriphila TaxID=168379 RepID=A0ABS1E5G9_9GAMM|nr:FtsH protease activity modulator HflK [Halorhodospira neutriphila]MBK1726372.1 FtsH protease activity modulator HflK [Halorhodospira neutriphila]
MAWNEPGGGSRDPWGGGSQGGGSGPPDLDVILRRLRDRARKVLGGRLPGGVPGGVLGFGALGLGAVLIWLLTGIYIVDAGYRGVEMTFGRHTLTTQPGPHWHWPRPIGTVEQVNVQRRRVAEVGYQSVQGSGSRAVADEALMITRDENIADVRIAAQYRVSDPARYLYNFRMPERSLKQVAESAVREVIGKRELDFVLTEGRTEVAQRTRELLQQVMNEYRTGLEVVEVAVQDIQPPEEVQPAFEDAIRAREDKQRKINQARAYAEELLPRARGQAARIVEQAKGYRERTVSRARGDAQRFEALLAEYRESPAVMRQRLYLETMEEVLGRVSKITLDSQSSQSLMYLPLDRLLERQKSSDSLQPNRTGSQQNPGVSGSSRDAITPTQRAREALRERGER